MYIDLNDMLDNVRKVNKWLTCTDKQFAVVTLTKTDTRTYWIYSWRFDPKIVEAVIAGMQAAIANRFSIEDSGVSRDQTNVEVTYTFVFRLYSEVDATLLRLHGIDGFKIQIHSAKDDKPYWQKFRKTSKATIPYKHNKNNW